MKALDIYLAVCFFMVFGALLEYATVTYAGKRIKLNMRRFEELEKQIKEVQAQAQAKSQVRDHSGGEGPQCSHHAATCPVKIKQLQIRSFEPAFVFPIDLAVRQKQPPTALCGWRPSDLERWARIVFPLFFVTFHFFYWTILINISDQPIEGLMPLKEN